MLIVDFINLNRFETIKLKHLKRFVIRETKAKRTYIG